VSTLARVLAGAQHILLDFDGPVCAVFGGTSDRAVADELRALLADRLGELPADVADSPDPFEILRHAATLGPQITAETEHAFADLEREAVTSATETPGAREAITALHHAGRTITITSNNGVRAILAYLNTSGLAPLIDGVIGRADPSPALLKPDPHLVLQAVRARRAQPAECALIGDSETDVRAAQAARVAAIAYANKPGKYDQLTATSPDAIITAMHEITAAIAPRGPRNSRTG